MRYPCSISIVMLLVIALSAPQALAGTFPAESSAAAAAIKRRVRAAQFLSWTTFGPKREEIEALAQRMEAIGETPALEEWIDYQFGLPATKHEPLALQMIAADGFTPYTEGIGNNRYKFQAWWHAAIAAPDQLRQRMAWALSQIFVINDSGSGFNTVAPDVSGNPQYLGVANYYDMLVDNAFGNYRQLLEDVTFHPIMGVFLTFVKNPRPIPQFGILPDENFAREVEQLFSIGLYKLRKTGVYQTTPDGELIETYDNEVIENFARVFTGLSFDDPARSFFGARPNFHQPMVMHEEWHDPDAKVLLDGQTLPAGQSGTKDIQDALDMLFNHPNVPPFIAHLLLQRFMRSNPSKGYIRHVANAFINNGQGVRGDFKAVLKAMFTHREAFKSQRYRVTKAGLTVTPEGTEYSRLQEPVIRYTSFTRAFDATPAPNAPAPAQGGWEERCNDYFAISAWIPPYFMNQQVYRAPHVFNFYLKGHTPSGDLVNYVPSRRIPNGTMVAPEFEIATAVAVNRVANGFRTLVLTEQLPSGLLNNGNGKYRCTINFDFSQETELASNPDALMTHLDLLLCQGSLQESTKESIASIITEETDNASVRAKGAIIAALTSSDCAVSE